MNDAGSVQLGITAIAIHEPPWLLPNDWFGATMPRKFVHHTGIESRPVSLEDEVAMAVRATESLRRSTGLDFADCAGVVFVSPSFIPMAAARRYFDQQRAQQELLSRAAKRFTRRLGIADRPVDAINWFCSGYPKALALANRRLAAAPGLRPDQFILVVTASRISRITDYGCPVTAPLFGDVATATLLARTDSHKYPPAFAVLYAEANIQPAPGVYFDFHLRERVLVPSEDGGQQYDPQRVVFSLDGLGIAEAAPRAMSNAVVQALRASHLRPEQVQFVVPHQAGTGIVRLAAMKLEDAQVHAEVINGMTRRVGNISSGSIPFALHQAWEQFDGIIACPTAAVGLPGKAALSQGCLLLRKLPSSRSSTMYAA